jgi:hypothetical protein
MRGNVRRRGTAIIGAVCKTQADCVKTRKRAEGTQDRFPDGRFRRSIFPR